MRDADDVLDALPVEDVEDVVRERVQAELLRVERLRGPPGPKQIGGDDAVPERLEERDLAAPVVRGGGEAVEEEEDRLLLLRGGRGEIVAVGVAAAD